MYEFRIWKNYVRRYSDDVLLHNCDVNLHLQNNFIKLQSLAHNQLSSRRYKNMFQYTWYKSGYVDTKLGDFENPVDFAFYKNTQIKCAFCDETPIVRRLWCGKALCLKFFFMSTIFVTNMNLKMCPRQYTSSSDNCKVSYWKIWNKWK